jgi:hypothetical protein
MDLMSMLRASASPGPQFGHEHSYRSPRLVASLLSALLAVELAALVIMGALLWDGIGLARALAAGHEVSPESLELFDHRVANITTIAIGLTIAGVAMLCWWTYRMATNAVALGGYLSTSPGWAAGSYFVPLHNLWRPYTALIEIWDASRPAAPVTPGGAGSHRLLAVWWIVWLASAALHIASRSMGAPAHLGAWVEQLAIASLTLAVQAAAVILTLAVVRKLTHRQEEHHAARIPAARIS